jgi:nicotinamide riboside transporter PnuC
LNLKELLNNEKKIDDPYDTIRNIYIKIYKWKHAKAKGSEEREDLIWKKLKPKKRLFVHNIKTATELLNNIKDEIGLEQHELYMMLYTCINM